MKLKELKQIIKEEVNIFLKEKKFNKKPVVKEDKKLVKEDKVLKIGNATVVIPASGAPQIHLPPNAKGKTLENILRKIKDELKSL